MDYPLHPIPSFAGYDFDPLPKNGGIYHGSPGFPRNKWVFGVEDISAARAAFFFSSRRREAVGAGRLDRACHRLAGAFFFAGEKSGDDRAGAEMGSDMMSDLGPPFERETRMTINLRPALGLLLLLCTSVADFLGGSFHLRRVG